MDRCTRLLSERKRLMAELVRVENELDAIEQGEALPSLMLDAMHPDTPTLEVDVSPWRPGHPLPYPYNIPYGRVI